MKSKIYWSIIFLSIVHFSFGCQIIEIDELDSFKEFLRNSMEEKIERFDAKEENKDLILLNKVLKEKEISFENLLKIFLQENKLNLDLNCYRFNKNKKEFQNLISFLNLLKKNFKTSTENSKPKIVIIGAGPVGLMHGKKKKDLKFKI